MVRIERIFLVWNADLSLRGALSYVAQQLSGSEECALCALTYDGLNEKREWKACKRDAGVPFEGVYKNRLTADQRAVVGDDIPCVLAHGPSGLIKLLGREAIESAAGDLDRFVELLGEAMASA